MARTRQTRAQESEPVTVDVVDQLTDKLSETGIDFVRDAWVEKAPDNYGVVELQGEAGQLWADGHLIDSVWRVVIHAYIAGDDDSIAYTVQNKLEELESAGDVDLTHTISRDFDAQVGKVHWQWIVNLYSSLIKAGEASGED